ncbi:MAG: DUF4981 domain-containing protein [Butyrivibrio sp.]|nr:DUF4981 domain-containing protein [Butyrivibrio sp.]
MNDFLYENVKNPEYFKENCMPAHSDHVAYASWEEQHLGDSSFRKSLDGIWKFSYARNMSLAVPGFEKEDYDAHSWEDIRVPAHIQMEGYDAPQYVNVQYPWDGREELRPGQIPEEFNPTASYVKYFHVPDCMKGKRIFISFQGVESGMAVWLNGNFVGYSEDSFTPSEFELTDLVKTGENKLAVRVFKWTSGSWCEDQDFYRFSGIYRSVYLYAIPDTHIYDMSVRTILDDEYENAQLDLSLIVKGRGKANIRLEKAGKKIFEKKVTLDAQSEFSFIVKKPELWSAEEPSLYQLMMEVEDEEGQLQECICQNVGFRRFELKNSLMLLNGKRIVFKGVNRHEFSSRTGRTVSKKEIIQDIVTMKRNNINAIRTCHYPDNSLIYELCDEYGLYMIAENNMETHGSWTGPNDESVILPGDHEEWLGAMLDRVNSCYQRDKNHPAILLWSCGNESYGGKVIYEMSNKFRELDDSRLVHYEGVFRDRRYNDTSDVESQMYPSVAQIREFLAKDRKKPFICCEYTHAMGNSCGAMFKYTDLTDTEPLYQGGFIWDYIDQSIRKKNRYGEVFQAYGGDFGERPTDYNFSGNGIVYGGDRDPSPKMPSVKYNYQNISIGIKDFTGAHIKNKNLFLNTDYYDCVVTLEREGKKVSCQSMQVKIAPLAEKEVTLPLTKPVLPGEYTVTVSFLLKEDTLWAKAGYEVAFGQKVLQVSEKAEKLSAQEEGTLKVIHGWMNLGVKGEHFDALFSFASGGLVSYRYAGKEMIDGIPMPNFWRAPTDNDNGNCMPQRYAQWKTASMYITHKPYAGQEQSEPMIQEEKDAVSITYTYFMPTTPQSFCTLTYRVSADGTIRTKLSYDPVKELADMPEFGVMFCLDADYDHVKWYGLGPQETYADRTQGAKLGIYEQKTADAMARYLVPQECGNKTGVRYAEVTDEKGRGLRFEGKEMNFSALPYSPHEMELAKHAYELPPVHHTWIRASLMQMGIAGDDSWGSRTQEEFLLKTDHRMEFEFSFKGI